MAKKRTRDNQLEHARTAREERCGTPYPSRRPTSEIRAPFKATIGRVLVVDDDPLVLAMTERTLRHHGFEIITAADGPSALQIYRDEGHAIDLVVLDVTMPEMSGIETCVALYALDEGVRVIFSSGYDAGVADGEELPDCVEAFVQKPYRPSELAALMQSLLDPD